MHARQMGGKCAALNAAFIGSDAGRRLILSVGDGFAGRNGLLDVLQRQGELIRIELLGTGTKVHAPQLLQEVLKSIILRPRFIPLRDGGVALSERRCKLCLQHGDFDGILICAHTEEGIRFARGWGKESAA
jgi:hypothetical protein